MSVYDQREEWGQLLGLAGRWWLMMCQRTDHLIQRIWALSSLGLVKSRGTQRATRIQTVAVCVFNMPRPLSGCLFCHLGSTVLCREPLWRDGDVKGSGGEADDGEHWEDYDRIMTGGLRQEEQGKPNAAQTSLDGQQKQEELKSHNIYSTKNILPSVPDQKHFLTCLIFTHSTRKHPKERSNVFYLEPETVH